MPVLDEEEKENFEGPNALHSSQEKRFKFDSLLSLAIPTQACSSNGGENHHSSPQPGWNDGSLLHWKSKPASESPMKAGNQI